MKEIWLDPKIAKKQIKNKFYNSNNKITIIDQFK